MQVGADVKQRSQLSGPHLKRKKHYLGCLTCRRPGNVWLVGATHMKATLCGLISSPMLLKRFYDDVLCHRPQALAASPLYYKML